MSLCNLRSIQSAKIRGLRHALSVPLLALILMAFAVCGSYATTDPPPPPDVTVLPGSLAGADLGDGDSVTTPSIHCSAVANRGPVSNDEVDVDGPHWSWSASASFLDDGQIPHDPSATGSASVDLHPGSPDTNSDCDYTVTFDSPGDYVVTLSATATYYETIKTGPHAGDKSTVTMSGDGNPGVDDTDAAPPASPNAMVPYAGNAPAPPKAPAKISSVSGGHSVYISSSLDPTFHKGSALSSSGDPLPEKDPIGKVNTIGELFGATIGYHANMKGSWPKDSHYLWHDSWGDPGDGKTDQNDFSGKSIPDFSVTYAALAPASHVYLHLSSRPSLTSNLYVTLHDTIENVQKHTKPDEDHPRPSAPTNANYDVYSEWNKIGPTMSESAEFEATVKGEYTVKIGTDTTVGIEAESAGVTAKIEQMYSVENEKTYGVDDSTKTILKFKEGFTYYIFWGMGWTRHFGTYDVYGTHGYKGRGHWHADIPQFTNGGHIAVIYYPVIAAAAN